MLTVQELKRIATTLSADEFEAQLGPMVLVHQHPDEVTRMRSVMLGARRTVAVSRSATTDPFELIFQLDDLTVTPLPPVVAPARITVGRMPDSDLLVDDPSVSKCHATLIFEGDGVRVEDQGSSNGTHVNGAQATPAAPIHDGDLLAFGDAHFLCLHTRTLHQKLTTGRFRPG